MSADDDVIKEAEQIGRLAFANFNVEEYEAMLFRLGEMLVRYRVAMTAMGFSQYFVEKVAWMIMTNFYGDHLTEPRIDFDPSTEIYVNNPGWKAEPSQGGSTADPA